MKIQMETIQQQTLSQRMLQSVQMLQMNSQELKTYLEELALENPLIDLTDTETPVNREEEIKRKLEWLQQSREDNRIYHEQDDDEEGDWNFAPADTGTDDLEELLKFQLLTKKLDNRTEIILEYMIQNLDSKGYLEITLDEVVEAFDIEIEETERILEILQGLEPTGIGARTLTECLLLQLRKVPEASRTAVCIVEEYLDLLARNQLPLIANKLGCSTDEVKAALEIIYRLNPKPGNSFRGRDTLKYIIPDITIVKLSDYYEILINDYLYPRISVNTYYKSILSEKQEADVVSYIEKKVDQAEWIKSCVERRQETLVNLCKTIVSRQFEFFDKGKGLKPLQMKEAAEILGVHESTVSRAVKDKYLQCIWGVYPLSYFFTKHTVQNSDEQQMLADDIKQMLLNIIENEDKKKPFSDQKIVYELEKSNCQISRRTVAKYRSSLGIKDTSGRRQY